MSKDTPPQPQDMPPPEKPPDPIGAVPEKFLATREDIAKIVDIKIQEQRQVWETEIHGLKNMIKALEAENAKLRNNAGKCEPHLTNTSTTTHDTPNLPISDVDMERDTETDESGSSQVSISGFQTVRSRKRRAKVLPSHSAKKKQDFPLLPPPNIPASTSGLLQNLKSLPKSQNVPQTNQTSTTSGSNPTSPQPKSVPKVRVPPLIIRDKSKYNHVTAHLKAHKISYGNAINITEGIKIHPPTESDYRFIQNYMESQKIPFHTFPFPDEKSLHVVLRGVLESWSQDKIKEDLVELGFTPSKVVRWFNKNQEPMPLVLVILPKTQKSIFDLNCLDSLRIKVESQHTRSKINQCHRCQLFGHAQSKCKADPKCLKCAKGHFTFECSKDKSTDATCANCGGNHPANYMGCPMHPKNLRIQRDVNKSRPNFQWGTQTNANLAPNSQKSHKMSQNLATVTDTNVMNPEIFPTIFNMFADMQKNMQSFMANMQSQFQSMLPLMTANPSNTKK